ncbi:CoA transferase, partial [Candidatus Bathyarchaeota archaeon]|nr:CoA transferase [Candidatus Bathyarchaeota archaeon]
QPDRMGSAHPSIVPYQAFNCRDRPLIIAVGNDTQWQTLCHVLNLEHLARRSEYSTNPQRVRNRQRLIPIISKRLRTRNASYWNRLLNKNQVPASMIYNISDVVRDPQIKHRGLFKKGRSAIPTLVSPIRFAKEERSVQRPPPKLGQDTLNVLRSA